MGSEIFSAALTKCFLCGEDNEIVINTRLTKEDAKEVKGLHGKVINKEPCPKCKKYMKQGIIIIAVDPEKTEDLNNPYRTGGWWVVKDDFIEHVKKFTVKEAASALEGALKRRVLFMDDGACRQFGLYDIKPTNKLDSE